MSALYRAAWTAEQEDGSRVTLHSQEYRSLDEATQDRDAALAVEYVTDAWVERAEWRRFDARTPSQILADTIRAMTDDPIVLARVARLDGAS